MNKRRILNAFRQAEKDWEKPLSDNYNDSTVCGLCMYFSSNGYKKELIFELQKCWLKYATKNPNKHNYHFYKWGDDEKGRAERLDAIREIIKDLEQPTNIQKFLNKYLRWISNKF